MNVTLVLQHKLRTAFRQFLGTADRPLPQHLPMPLAAVAHGVSTPAPERSYHPSPVQRATPRACTMPLRVVRILDAGLAPQGPGRMVISGRMADVCAELDRLASREALLH